MNNTLQESIYQWLFAILVVATFLMVCGMAGVMVGMHTQDEYEMRLLQRMNTSLSLEYLQTKLDERAMRID